MVKYLIILDWFQVILRYYNLSSPKICEKIRISAFLVRETLENVREFCPQWIIFYGGMRDGQYFLAGWWDGILPLGSPRKRSDEHLSFACVLTFFYAYFSSRKKGY